MIATSLARHIDFIHDFRPNDFSCKTSYVFSIFVLFNFLLKFEPSPVSIAEFPYFFSFPPQRVLAALAGISD